MGYYHPSTANWAYHIFLIIDRTGARLYKSTFGADASVAQKYNIKRTGATAKATYKWRDVRNLPDIENYQGKNYPVEF